MNCCDRFFKIHKKSRISVVKKHNKLIHALWYQISNSGDQGLSSRGGGHCNYSFLEGSFRNHLVIFIVEGRPHDLPFTERTSKQFRHEGFILMMLYISQPILLYRGVSIDWSQWETRKQSRYFVNRNFVDFSKHPNFLKTTLVLLMSKVQTLSNHW